MYRLICSFLLTLVALPAMAGPPDLPPGLTGRIESRTHIEYIELRPLNAPGLLAEDIENEARGEPPRYAVVKDIDPVTPRNGGTWTHTKDGSQVWRYRVRATDATSVELGFERFHLPEGAALYVYGNNGKRVRGPFTAKNNEAHGELWVPIVEGELATIELVLQPGTALADVTLELSRVAQGYRAFWKDHGGRHAGACNVDVACPVANGWEDQIQSVARITIGGGLCSGQMIANTDGTNRPLFLTANHCGIRAGNASGMTVYWNYENSECREPGSAASGLPGDDDALDQAQSGATFIASYASTDFTLVELDDAPEPEYNVFWTGWDHRDRTFDGGTGIHHPLGEEKRISFENDPLRIIDGQEINAQTVPDFFPPGVAIPRSHLEVPDWDQGVTEGGSSGSGLWSPGHRLIGQLTGGQVNECEVEPDFDWYGRLAVSWAGGGTPDSALRPWLDPAGTGEKFIDGYYACGLADAFTIDITPAKPNAGDLVTLRAVPPAGAALSDFTYRWDVNGDGHFDGEGAVLKTRFDNGLQAEVSVEVQQKSGDCNSVFNKTINIQAPSLILESVGAPEQITGDGDDNVEPGEAWRLPVTLKNSGDARADAVIAVFTRAGVTSNAQATGGPDGFGYTFSDSGTVSCPYQFEDISQAANRVKFTQDDTPDNGVPPRDDGGTEPITLDNFDFYGRNVNAVVMSSNGYLTTSAGRHGGDFENKCPLPATPNGDEGGARLAVFHDDLITGEAYSAHFNNCPRPPDGAGASGACQIFQWNDVGLIGPSPSFDELDVPHFDFQAILYEGSNEVVYQFGPATPQTDGSPTVGIQNDPATVGLTYACQSAFNTVEPGHPKAQSAVCFFHPDSVQNEAADAFSITTPDVGFGNIPVGQSAQSELIFTVHGDAACGDVIGVQLHGAVFDGGFSAGPGLVYTTRLGGPDAVCDAPAFSNAKTSPPLQHIPFKTGLWYNPDRDGHGADISRANDGDTSVITWYTFDDARSPVWYQAAGPYRNNQIHADLFRYTWDGDEAIPEDVGEVIFTVQGSPPIGSKANSALFNWTLNGEKGGEPFQALIFSKEAPPVNRSGLWFPPTQSGWGVTFNNQGLFETGVLFFYDAAGQPIWALGVKENPSSDTMPLQQFIGTCPGCPWVKQTADDAGSLTRSFSGPKEGTLSTDVDIQPPREGQWNKGPVSIKILTDPQP